MKRRLVAIALVLAACVAAFAETAEEKAARKEAERAAAEAKQARNARIKEHENRIRELQAKIREKGAERDRKNRELRRMMQSANSSSNSVNRGMKRIAELETSIARISTNTIPRQTQRIAELETKLRSIEQVSRRNDRALQVQKVDNAVESQRQVLEKVKRLRDILSSEQPEKIQIAPKEHVEDELVSKNAAAMEIVEAYELAKQIEDKIIESYKDIKATQTAISRRMSYDSAQKLTDVPKPVRIEANAEALRNVARTKDALDAKKAEQVKVVREAETMVDATVEMMNEAMEIVMKQSPEKAMAHMDSKSVKWLTDKDFASMETAEEKQQRLEQMQNEAEYQVQITEAAAENESERAKDISSLMKNAIAESGQSDGKPEAKQQRGSAPGGPPPLSDSDMDILPGNKVCVRGQAGDVPSARWMYVNDWYVIGPFPNPNRENLRRKFPPESVVDLNATYAGKNGETVSWKFMQCENSIKNKRGRAHVVPRSGAEYVIWYAYAEVFFDEECDRWIAIGSDDRSDFWINGYPVWGSSNKLKQWNIAEGFRKCHFKKGRNELLIRVENGWHSSDWSVCIALSEDERAGLP